jgi:hypothetical protein
LDAPKIGRGAWGWEIEKWIAATSEAIIPPDFRCLRGRLFGLGRQSETRKKPNRKIEGDSP